MSSSCGTVSVTTILSF